MPQRQDVYYIQAGYKNQLASYPVDIAGKVTKRQVRAPDTPAPSSVWWGRIYTPPRRDKMAA
jgi:hypothetical protein